MRAGSWYVIERDLPGTREIRHVEDVDVASRAHANLRRTGLLAHECITSAAHGVVQPPDIVRVAADCRHRSEDHRRARRTTVTAAADVPDLDPRVPQRDEQQSVAQKGIVDKGRRVRNGLHEDLPRI